MQSQSSKCNGTFTFCISCPVNSNCCSRVKISGEIDSPILFPKDVEDVQQLTGLKVDCFSEPISPNNGKVRVMRTNSNGCYFYHFPEGKCEIYPVRPIDCRLFPFDIKEKSDGSLVWIAYTQLCPIEFDPYAYLNHVKAMVPQLRYNIQTYARTETPELDKQARVELSDVEYLEDYSFNSYKKPGYYKSIACRWQEFMMRVGGLVKKASR